MATYKTRLTKTFNTEWGVFRLFIYEKTDGFGIAREIGEVFTSLALNIEGQSDDIDAPIIKSTLTFSLIDAPEKDSGKEKWGNWEELYTSDATKWKVELSGKSTDEQEFKTLWSGYLTPDSFTETLQYHGVVTITARDNIGHLQDFDFDAKGNAEGMITPYELITEAWAKIDCPMTLDWRGDADENEWPQAEGVDAVDMYFNVSAFKGRTWYEAVSDTLSSLGLVMRYIGMNRVAVCPLRRLPAQGMESADVVRHLTPVFMAYGTRELAPAVKEIEEVVNYDLEQGEDQPLVNDEDFTGNTVSCIVNAENVFGEITQKTIAVWPINNESETGWGNIRSNTLFFDTTRYANSTVAEPGKGQTYLAVNTEPRMVWYGRMINCQNLRMRLESGMMVERYGENILFVPNFAYEVKSIVGAIKLTLNGVEYYYDGDTWLTSYVELNMPFDGGVIEQDFKFGKKSGIGLLQIFIFSVDVEWKAGYGADKGAFLGIKALNLSLKDSTSMMESNTVRTIYDENNNIRLSRTPALGPAYDKVAIPGLIGNAIFRKENNTYVPAPEWKWKQDSEAYQLAVLVHKQLLCYHSKPNNLLSGTIVNASLVDPRAIWTWKGKEHLLLSGSLNILTGHIDGAVLREFRHYSEMWN